MTNPQTFKICEKESWILSLKSLDDSLVSIFVESSAFEE